MVKKKSKKVVKVSTKEFKSDSEKSKFWFRKRRGLSSPDMGYGWIPVTWQGYVTVSLLILVNALSVLYFNLKSGDVHSILKFLLVLALSVLGFVIIAIKKTKKVSNDI